MSHYIDFEHEASSWLSDAVLRFATFSALGITHTCCKMPYCYRENFKPYCKKMDEQEVEEIRQEEHLLLEKLDMEVEHLKSKYAELRVSLPEFLKGYWMRRMEEIMNESDSLSEEEIKQIEDVGVILHR